MNIEYYISIALGSLNLIIIAFTLFYIARQSRDTSRSLEEIKKSNRFQAMINVRLHLSDINRILIENPMLAEKFGYNTADILAYHIISDFEKLYLQYQEGLVDAEYWTAQDNLIKNTMNREFIRKAWSSHPAGNNELHPKFRKYINDYYSTRINEKSKMASE